MEINLTPPTLVIIIAPEAEDREAIQGAFGESELADEKQPEEIAAMLERGNVAVADATRTNRQSRDKLRYLAQAFHAETVAIAAMGRPTGNEGMDKGLQKTLRGIRKEGFGQAHVLETQQACQELKVRRRPQPTDRRDLSEPFDLIGDVHGCHEELTELLQELGYESVATAGRSPGYRHPEGRTAVFLGDLTDRGPDSPKVLRTVMEMCQSGAALCVMGNHDNKLMRHLMGNKVSIADGLAQTLDQITKDDGRQELEDETLRFLTEMPHHLWLDGGKLVAVHAGIREGYINRNSRAAREFCYYGDVTGRKTAEGFPVRGDWTQAYKGEALVAYGHNVTVAPRWSGNTVGLDTGCVFGGSLTALRYPELETRSIKAKTAVGENWYQAPGW